MDSLDLEGRTPLLLAAGSGGSGALRVLINAGADPTVRDARLRNILHFIVSQRKDLVTELETVLQVCKMLNYYLA